MIDELMKLANKKAIEYNHEYIGTEHFLLTLLDYPEINDALKAQEIDSKEVKSALEKITCKGPDMVPRGKLPLTPRTKKSLEYANEIAKENERETPNALDVLDGLYKENECIASGVLKNFGYIPIPEKITPESVLLRGGFEIRENKAYRSSHPRDYVVDLTKEKPKIIYQLKPHLIDDALKSRKLFQEYHFPFSESPPLSEVVKSLEDGISERASLIERILELGIN